MNLLLILFSTYLIGVEEEVIRLEEKISPYVYTVYADNGNVTMTGTVVDPYHIVTVGFIREGEPIQIEDKFGNIYRAKTLGCDPTTGIDLIETAKKFRSPSLLKKLKKGQICYVYGNSFGSMGMIGMGFLQSPEGISCNLSIPLSPGNNGAGVFDVQGRLIGIVGGKVNRPGFLEDLGSSSSNFAEVIKIDYILSTLDQIKRMGTVKRAWLGLLVRSAPSNMGVIVEKVIEESPADSSGIQNNDLIIAVDGNNIPDIERFKEMILTHEPGEKITLTIIRRKERLEIP
ncbi:MAG: S1C family serine protease, partial [candidate division WOR-3 bacterium]|nr:S1C family serine protease [candidate division WOR-3 bacterium]